MPPFDERKLKLKLITHSPFQLTDDGTITVFYQVQCTLTYIENDAEIFPVHYTWRVADKEFKMAFMINKDAMINACKIILEKKIPKVIVNFSSSLYLYAHYILNKIRYLLCVLNCYVMQEKKKYQRKFEF